MRPPLQNGKILITGASSGIGREIARQLGGVAKALVLVARRGKRLQALKDELLQSHKDLIVYVAPCDLQDLSAIDEMLERVDDTVGSIDVVINNAGLADGGLFEFSSWEKISLVLNVNMTALTYLTHRLVGGMVKRGKGGFLNISSGFGLTFMPGLAAYVGTKHYVTSFTECLRIEMAGTGVVVTQSCPGPVDTEFEEVAGNPTGKDVPKFVTLSPERCARISLRGFRRGRALVMPGIWMSIIMTMARLTPRPLLRFVYRFGARFLRRRQS